MSIRGREIDIVVLILFALFGILYAFLTKDLFIGRSVFSGLVFTLLPTIYLGLRKKKSWNKIIVFTLVFGGLFGFLFDFYAEFNKAYHVVSTIFPFRIFGILPLDNILGHMMMALLTVTFYEHFIDREIHHKISSHLKFAVLPGVFAGLVFILLFFFNRELLQAKYPYLYAGIVAVIFPVYLGFKKPQFIKNMAETAIYFFFLWFASELLAVRLNYWIYPGNNYIGWITVFGLSFPFEELFFWMVFYAATLVSFYELFIDDHSRSPHPHV